MPLVPSTSDTEGGWNTIGRRPGRAAGAGGGQRRDQPARRPGLGACGRLRQRHQLAGRCPPDAPVAARIGPGRRHHPRHHPRGIAAAGIELPHRRQHRPGRGRTPAHLACPRSAKQPRSSAGGTDRPGTCPFTEVVEVRLLGLLQPLEPLVAWLLHRQATADLRRLKHLLETPPLIRGPTPEETTT